MNSAHTQAQRLSGLAAMMVLVVGMGFGRFAFTGIYPLMVTENLLSVSAGSLAASANYAGYLLGALALAKLNVRHAPLAGIFALLATVAALALPGVVSATWALVWIRGLAGVFSAVALVAGSVWLLHYMNRPHSAPLLYSGVGVGIFLSAEIIALSSAAGWRSMSIWLLLALAGALLAAFACTVLWRSRRDGPAAVNQPNSGAAPAASAFSNPWQLIGIYGLAGLGYIITATYLPVLINQALGGVGAIHVWAVFGLGAIPSCFLWHRINLRLGARRSLLLNLLIQGFGVMLPAFGTSLPLSLASAVLVGGTFMGTVTIAMPAARALAAKVSFNMLAVMTAVYGIGQIAGPLAADALYQRSGTFSGALIFAAAALWLATALCLLTPHSFKRSH
ncbi:YbfB/YjiJ family MFS transporter [Pasteurella testudinis]|uniref:YbfB/YjiJ family MFS transporter n=1 Tax=Pasteurella testudinis TaxID=761 RepID=UPI0040593C60